MVELILVSVDCFAGTVSSQNDTWFFSSFKISECDDCRWIVSFSLVVLNLFLGLVFFWLGFGWKFLPTNFLL